MTFEELNVKAETFDNNYSECTSSQLFNALPAYTLDKLKDFFILRVNTAPKTLGDYTDTFSSVSADVAEIILQDGKDYNNMDVQNAMFESGLFGWYYNNVTLPEHEESVYTVLTGCLAYALEQIMFHTPVCNYLNNSLAHNMAKFMNVPITIDIQKKIDDVIDSKTLSENMVEEFMDEVERILKENKKKETVLKIVEKHCNDINASGMCYDEFTSLAKLLPSNAMDIANGVAKYYGYHFTDKNNSWDRTLMMCSDIAQALVKATDNESDVYDVMMKYFFSEFIANCKYDKDRTMKDVAMECYHNALKNLFSESYMLRELNK